MTSQILFRPTMRRAATALLCAFALSAVSAACAQVVVVSSTPVVGSSNPASPEPPVTRPSTAPCTVTLFDNEAFADYSAHPISYAPPASCPGPWAKVVLTVDFTVTKGRQFDRTASLYLGNANIFYGTTAEPRSALSPSWRVEKDITDLSAILMTPQSGQSIIYNIVNSTYTGVIYGTAKLMFYPVNYRNAAPITPQVVIPVSGINSPYALNTTISENTTSFTAPRNVERAYLDVIAQSQSNDEFWYLCVPNEFTNQLQSCGNTSFRETEVTIDGKPAGVAPVYPWIYTGGIDPYLWEPITGIQTLNFKPYRVDLTPFAGLLSDGAQHTIGISVFNANNYFLATANLLLYTDPFRRETGGDLIEDTLSPAPMPSVSQNLATDASGNTTGTVDVESYRHFTLKGYVHTSHGRVETTVEQDVHFKSAQTFNVGSNDIQNAVQTSTVNSKTTSQQGALVFVRQKEVSLPLTLDYAYVVNPDGSSAQTVSVKQRFQVNTSNSLNGSALESSSTVEEVKSADTLSFNASGGLSAVGPTNSSASYIHRDSSGDCYSRDLTSENRILTAVTNGTACLDRH